MDPKTPLSMRESPLGTARQGWPLAGIYLMRALGMAILLETRGTGMLMVFVVLYGFFTSPRPLSPL